MKSKQSAPWLDSVIGFLGRIVYKGCGCTAAFVVTFGRQKDS